jgi:trigger factor
MDIVETTNEGLKRSFALTIPAKEIDAKIDAEVKKVAPKMRMPGFRPGKVPANLVRKMHGEALHSEVLNTTVRESVDGLIREKRLRPALQPRVDMKDGYEPGKDAELTVEMEVLPEFEVPDLSGLTLERLTVPVSDEALDETLGRLAANQKSYDDAPEGKQAEDGDQVVIDFVGRVGGEEFEGGKGEGHALVLGSGQFIPGFEEQLVGAKAGEQRTITVTFPAEYPAENLKGQEAEFDVTVSQVKVAGEAKIDEDFAKSLGLEGLDKLKELMRAQLEQETARLTRTQMKRQLLDKLAKDHDFPVPQSMVEAEFEQIWQQLTAEAAREEDTEAAMAELEAEKEDYRRIAERRVRLGLLLSEIGQRNGVEITSQEMQMLLQQAAQQYRPEDRERFVEYVRNEPMAQAQLRAPLYEDKVVDFLFDKAEVTEREVTREELEAAIEAEEDTGEGKPEAEPEAEKPAAKKKGKKAPAEAEVGTDGVEAGEAQADGTATAAEPAPKKASGRKKSAKSEQQAEAASEEAAEPANEAGDGAEVKPAKKAAKKAATKKA